MCDGRIENICAHDTRVFFNIQKIDNKWKIINIPLPKWIIENEDAYNEVIEEELRQQ